MAQNLDETIPKHRVKRRLRKGQCTKTIFM
ncbi:hypothetical protein SPSIL_021840 [Sporomusa silvacetica DSM 10669]|uniref:30S ribosomal protein S18 n=1 Tax=Sporomusa silvacetica DSM 10669 TaxID=1123289 RepID=A0ABZ3IK42_9FIRM|nr:hypothetical protein SPSIL_31890 [Sporomusa silvacetica DSM 10669]